MLLKAKYLAEETNEERSGIISRFATALASLEAASTTPLPSDDLIRLLASKRVAHVHATWSAEPLTAFDASAASLARVAKLLSHWGVPGVAYSIYKTEDFLRRTTFVPMPLANVSDAQGLLFVVSHEELELIARSSETRLIPKVWFFGSVFFAQPPSAIPVLATIARGEPAPWDALLDQVLAVVVPSDDGIGVKAFSCVHDAKKLGLALGIT